MLHRLAYAINGGDMGAPPMFMPSPGGGGNDLGLGDPRLLGRWPCECDFLQ